jgi:hypothetical protein
VEEWPAVSRGASRPKRFCSYLAGFDSGKPVDILRTPPSAHGRIFYNDAIDGFNLHARPWRDYHGEGLAREARFDKPSAVVVQSARSPSAHRALAAENVLPTPRRTGRAAPLV